jgi:hypothetical protein
MLFGKVVEITFLRFRPKRKAVATSGVCGGGGGDRSMEGSGEELAMRFYTGKWPGLGIFDL